ncbi:MAG: alpha/beta hydrolase [Erysipelotrichaceae bacterium]
MKEGYVTCNGAKICYTQYGYEQAPCLVLLHGNGEDSSYFQNQIEYFEKDYHVIAIDSRGQGKSELNTDTITIKMIAEDIIQILEALNIKQAHILGFSDGANVALYIATEYPKVVKSLILNGANYNVKGLKSYVKISTEIESTLYYILSGLKLENKYDKNLILNELMLENQALDINKIKEIKVKTLIIVGEKDMIKIDHTKQLATAIKNSELVVVPQASHFVALNKPKMFNNLVKDFLDKQKVINNNLF